MKRNFQILFLGFLSLLALILVYLNHFDNAFHFDDTHTITNNLYIRDLKNIPLFFKDVTTFSSNPLNQLYRPVLVTTLAIDYWLGKGVDSTFYFHLTNFFWYALMCMMLYFLFLKIFNQAKQHQWNPYLALFAATWYAFHTANAETVNYIIARSDLLSTALVVMAFVIYQYFSSLRKFGLYLIPYILACLVKQSAVVFCALLFFYILFFEQKNFRSTILKTILQSTVAIIICIVMLVVSFKMTPPTFTPGGSRFNYMITQPFVILDYFKTFFLPTELSADTDWRALNSIKDWKFFVGMIFVLLMIYIAFRTSKKEEWRPVSFGIIWFFITLLPSSSIIPLAEVKNDHRIFSPYIGLAMSVCWAIGLFIVKKEKSILENRNAKRLILIFVLFIISANAYGTYLRNEVWDNDESLWYDVTIKSPRNGRGLMNYGLTLMKKRNYNQAFAYFEKALEYNPYYSYLHVNIAILKNAMGKPLEAEQYFKKGVAYGPNDPTSYFYYGRWLYGRKRINEAIFYLKKSLELSAGFIDARYTLMELYFIEEEQTNLRQLADETLKIFPNDETAKKYSELSKGMKDIVQVTEETAAKNPTPENYLTLSLYYFRAKRFDDCIRACQEALKLKPDYAEAYNNICSAYNELKKWDEAIKACEKAVQLKPDFQLAKNNLNLAKSQMGK